MPSSSTHSRIERLDRLKGLLRSRDHVTIGELGAELRVSARTIARDLALLRQSGVPVDADRGRGGGIRASARWDYGRLSLNSDEALDLLVSIAVAESLNSPLLLKNLAVVRSRLAVAFAAKYLPAIKQLRSRVLIGAPASDEVRQSYGPVSAAILAPIRRAFVETRRLHLTYSDQQDKTTVREVEPQFIYLNVPVWYLLSWDYLRNDVRAFRIDRIKNVVETRELFRFRHRDLFLSQAEQQVRLL